MNERTSAVNIRRDTLFRCIDSTLEGRCNARGASVTVVTPPPRFLLPAIVRRIRALSMAFFACALPAVATAGADAPPAIRYALAAWSNEQSGDVFAIAQDLDGYLWLGTA